MFGKTQFGMVEFGHENYHHDIVVKTEENVYKRDKTPSKTKYGTSHILSAAEIIPVLTDLPEVLVVGCGQSGVLSVGEDAKELLSKEGVELVDLPTPKAIELYNKLKEQGRTVAAVIHVTC